MGEYASSEHYKRNHIFSTFSRRRARFIMLDTLFENISQVDRIIKENETSSFYEKLVYNYTGATKY